MSANIGGVGRGPAGLDTQVLPDAPAQYGQPLQERSEAGLPYRIIGKCREEHADAPYPLALLRPRHERPRRRRAAEQRDEFAPGAHSITSSARASSVSGTTRPSALAVVRLTTSSNLVGCSTGRRFGGGTSQKSRARIIGRCLYPSQSLLLA